MNDCDLMNTLLSALWGVIGAVIAGSVCFILGRRSHPVERAAKRQTKVRELVYRGPGGGRL
jgi:hypothetical protein